MRPRVWRLFTIVLVILAATQLSHCDDDSKDAEEPACQVEPTSLDFDTLQVGTSDVRDIVITNVGGGTLGRTVADTCDVFGIVGGPSSYDLQAGESHTITVIFQPTSVGAFACTLDVGTPLCTVVPCRGVARPVDQPVCRVEPASLDFDTLQVGTSDVRDIVITNVGGSRLAHTVADTCDLFVVVGGPSSYDIGAGESHTITVRFQPISVGAFACTLDVGTPLCALVPVRGVSRPVIH